MNFKKISQKYATNVEKKLFDRSICALSVLGKKIKKGYLKIFIITQLLKSCVCHSTYVIFYIPLS